MYIPDVIYALQAIRGGLSAIPTASVLQEHKNQCDDFAETTAFERYGVKTSEKANMRYMHNQHRSAIDIIASELGPRL